MKNIKNITKQGECLMKSLLNLEETNGGISYADFMHEYKKAKKGIYIN